MFYEWKNARNVCGGGVNLRGNYVVEFKRHSKWMFEENNCGGLFYIILKILTGRISVSFFSLPREGM